MAVHNYPRFLSAVKLTEEIQQANEWEDDTSVASDFMKWVIDEQSKGTNR